MLYRLGHNLQDHKVTKAAILHYRVFLLQLAVEAVVVEVHKLVEMVDLVVVVLGPKSVQQDQAVKEFLVKEMMVVLVD